ncbi:putative C6 transcription factor [Xylona heveae TC161]|uniref:Putative C6 transcription factor n=1 Tax=Xylona heveae (strain CBS 132557 / TC161) TaxID=1328760 RepID=A0A165HYV8_XYLHT|nr:putative C6 transcription factor [Xylona heveae TC161]KZF24113.1 putative C6 transcription factor [Xylona heveae TC161]
MDQMSLYSDEDDDDDVDDSNVNNNNNHHHKGGVNGNGNGNDDENDSSLPRDDVCESVIKKALNQAYDSNDHILFGPRKINVNLSFLHPEQVQIFRLWQIYLENINPLLKVTHTPTLQARIIDAASDVANISPTFEALMFSIYCVSVLSLFENECRTLFGSPREDLLASYRFGCQQALLNCEALRSDDHECLTALYLYLISVRLDADPRSLSSMLGVAIRIAQRMGIHNESNYARCSALEAEMRRRLWWSLVNFDNRICEISDHKSSMLAPTWDCRTPLNVNEFDIRPEMRTLPAVHEQPTDALFAVVCSELGDCIRHRAFHLDFTNPSLKGVAKDTRHGAGIEGGELIALEKAMEDKYLRFCNSENPLHYMTIWFTRGYLAKSRLLEHYSRYPLAQQTGMTDRQRDAATSYALCMLECDTKLMTSPLTKGYLWLVQFHFPFPAYLHIAQDLKKRPLEEYVEKTWKVMSDNYEARFLSIKQMNPFLKFLSKIILQAWEACEAAFQRLGKPLELPRIVPDIRSKMMQMTSNAQNNKIDRPSGALDMSIDDFSMPIPMEFRGFGTPYGMEGQDFAGLAPEIYPDIHRHTSMDVDMNHLDGTTTDWYLMHA